MTDAGKPLKRTPLHELHLSLGAKMVEFAGYDMPVQYPDGVLKEHLWTRTRAGLFDVSHMGQAFLRTTETARGTEEAHAAVAAAIETLVPGEVLKLKRGAMRYSVLLNEQGGVLDDLMITRAAMGSGDGMLFLVVNAACKDADFALIKEKLGGRVELEILADRALIALQGPKAAAVIESHFPGAATQAFMSMRPVMWGTSPVLLSRCGYTGEDGFEISVPNADAERFSRALLDHPDVAPIGLGARDSLRLEAGLCLYGHDLDPSTSPVEGNISFIFGKRRKEAGDFPGAARILPELTNGPRRMRVGLKPEGRAPAREGTEIVDAAGAKIGVVTSGGFGPTLNAPVAMGYVEAAHAKIGAQVFLMVRGKSLPAIVADMPFVPHTYYRG
ncbi:MAG TPA: glycine cleavage system aminomethyltransferase GcvT [Parvularcula sp.]|nr:glycine cleavage system aminomethyltransferase GcvT [Parvularcula sp.]HBS31390.1 glycine cleavage system aminomethyltransferase GcvT [Parvularcula sp.]HBS36174.1 glycine cleavage system aminomethyltransferase GcvT [Parvularcula sp.]